MMAERERERESLPLPVCCWSIVDFLARDANYVYESNRSKLEIPRLCNVVLMCFALPMVYVTELCLLDRCRHYVVATSYIISLTNTYNFWKHESLHLWRTFRTWIFKVASYSLVLLSFASLESIKQTWTKLRHIKKLYKALLVTEKE